jgi:predicted membrane channel-forming protein YqfA (hemolysin III family)
MIYFFIFSKLMFFGFGLWGAVYATPPTNTWYLKGKKQIFHFCIMGGVAVVWIPPHTHLMKEDYITMTVIPMKVGCFDEM